MSRTALLVAVIAAAFATAGHAAGDPIAGAQKNFQCRGCHGIPGWKTAYPEVYHVPLLGGQHAAYLVAALKEYQKGARDHPTMRAIASVLSEKDMEDLAAYYAQGIGGATAAGK